MSLNSLNSLLDKAMSVANVAGKNRGNGWSFQAETAGSFLNADLQNCYERIGSLVYRSRKSGLDNEAEITEIISQVDDLLQELAQIQSKREELKK